MLTFCFRFQQRTQACPRFAGDRDAFGLSADESDPALGIAVAVQPGLIA